MRQRHTIDAWGTKLYFDCEGAEFDSVAAFAEIGSFVGLVDDLFSTYKSYFDSDGIVKNRLKPTIEGSEKTINSLIKSLNMLLIG